ncbi:MAG: hypothetical protein JEZ04_18290 [Spirochaetales bacterium]|nr:hypothetical protein [Spirochaetales bacterium]
MKKKILLTVTGLLIVIMLTSCLDAIEYITLDKQGNIKLSFMITISKSLFEMGGEGESVEETFEDEIMDPEEISELIPGATNIEARLVDSDIDYGYLFTFTLPRNYQPTPETPMAPRLTKRGMEILLAMSNSEEAQKEESDESMDDMAAAIFSSAKYKVQISKQLLKSASRAYIYTADGEETSVDLVDLGDNYLVNLPMLMIMMDEEESRLVFEY